MYLAHLACNSLRPTKIQPAYTGCICREQKHQKRSPGRVLKETRSQIANTEPCSNQKRVTLPYEEMCARKAVDAQSRWACIQQATARSLSSIQCEKAFFLWG